VEKLCSESDLVQAARKMLEELRAPQDQIAFDES
jgi:hypothetical protein